MERISVLNDDPAEFILPGYQLKVHIDRNGCGYIESLKHNALVASIVKDYEHSTREVYVNTDLVKNVHVKNGIRG